MTILKVEKTLSRNDQIISRKTAGYSEPAIHVSKVSDYSIRESKRRPEVGGGAWILF